MNEVTTCLAVISSLHTLGFVMAAAFNGMLLSFVGFLSGAANEERHRVAKGEAVAAPISAVSAILLLVCFISSFSLIVAATAFGSNLVATLAIVAFGFASGLLLGAGVWALGRSSRLEWQSTFDLFDDYEGSYRRDLDEDPRKKKY